MSLIRNSSATELVPGAHRAAFLLDPSWDFLNHGSFGACPRPVLEAQRRNQEELEAQPVAFLVRTLPERLEALRRRFGAFLGADPAGLAFIQNATTGIASVLGSVPLQPGDRVLTTSHRYYAVRRALDRAAAAGGWAVDEAPLPAVVLDDDGVIEAIFDKVTPKTRLLVVDALTSPSALRLPVERICALARQRGILTLVDGAHAPGHVPVDLGALGADWWVGNLHKWLCAPKGAALLWAGEAHRGATHQAIPSHGYQLGLHAEFDWPGTFDPSAWLASGAALDLHEAWGGPALMAANHALAGYGQRQIAAALGVEPPHADSPDRYGAMAALRLPLPAAQARPLYDALVKRRFELPIQPFAGEVWLRISAFSPYNVPDQYDRLAALLPSLVRGLA